MRTGRHFGDSADDDSRATLRGDDDDPAVGDEAPRPSLPHGQPLGHGAAVERAVPQGPVADVDVVPVQRRDLKDVLAVGEVGGGGVAEPGPVGGEHDLPVHGAQPLDRIPGVQEGALGQLLVRQADRFHLVGGEDSPVEDEPDLSGAVRAGPKVGMVRGEGVDGEYGRQRQVQPHFLGDLAPTGDMRVFTVFHDTAGQHPRAVLTVGGVHHQDLAHLVGDDRGGT